MGSYNADLYQHNHCKVSVELYRFMKAKKDMFNSHSLTTICNSFLFLVFGAERNMTFG